VEHHYLVEVSGDVDTLNDGFYEVFNRLADLCCGSLVITFGVNNHTFSLFDLLLFSGFPFSLLRAITITGTYSTVDGRYESPISSWTGCFIGHTNVLGNVEEFRFLTFLGSIDTRSFDNNGLFIFTFCAVSDSWSGTVGACGMAFLTAFHGINEKCFLTC
jgi:hypothetical protein